MINDFSEGGLKMIDIASFNKSLKATWIQKYLNPENRSKWKPPAITKFQFGREQLSKLGREGSDVIQLRQQKQLGYFSMPQVST